MFQIATNPVLSTDPIDNLLPLLRDVRETGNGRWRALCPVHDDTTPSLDVTRLDDGRVLAHCKACGANGAKVAESLGLQKSALFPPKQKQPANRRIVKAYQYRDESGTVLYEAVRYEPKDFLQRRPNPDGTWKWSTKGVRHVLYRLPELNAADRSEPVFVCEGEKDADNVAAIGLCSTTNVAGSANRKGNKWRSEYSEHLAGRNVAILIDNDPAGQEHGETVAKALTGKAASVKVVELPGLAEKGDVSDWLAAGGTRDQLLQIAADTPEWEPKSITADPEPSPFTSLSPDDPEYDDLDPSRPENRCDLANARRFSRLHGDKFRYVVPWAKWLAWDGTRWRLDDSLAVAQAYRHVVDELFNRAAAKQNSEVWDFACDSANSRDITAAITLARSEAGIPVAPSCLDADPWLLNCTNGTLDLQTGKLRPHQQTDYLTALAPTAFKPDATSGAWERFLDSTFGQSRPLVEFVQRWFGYCLTGAVTEQRLPVFWGAGANGKSTLLNAAQDVLGSDFVTAGARDLLLAKRGDSHPTELADLFGKRLIVCAESDEGRALAEGQLKQLTGGDRIKARRMREDFWEFEPSHKMVLVTNHLPRVRGDDHAIWRRLLLVPFAQKFWNPDAGESGPEMLRQDKTLQAKLRAEREGILAWMVRGCLEWQQVGLCPPPEVQRATEDYRSREDRIGEFLEDRCLISPMCKVKAGDIYEAYSEWCSQLGETPYSGSRFGALISARFEKRRSNGMWYCGVGLREDTKSVAN